MKVLLDECVVQDFRHEIVGHDVYTVGYMGWLGVKNGSLLARAGAGRFDVLVTTDRGLEHQQNLDALPLAVVLLRPASNDLADLQPLVPELLKVLAALGPRKFVVVG